MAHAASQLKKKADENLNAVEDEKEKKKKAARKRSRELKKKWSATSTLLSLSQALRMAPESGSTTTHPVLEDADLVGLEPERCDPLVYSVKSEVTGTAPSPTDALKVLAVAWVLVVLVVLVLVVLVVVVVVVGVDRRLLPSPTGRLAIAGVLDCTTTVLYCSVLQSLLQVPPARAARRRSHASLHDGPAVVDLIVCQAAVWEPPTRKQAEASLERNSRLGHQKGNTALHIASLAGQTDVVKLLVVHQANVNAQSQ
ncbi:hypothetical protein CRUP_027296, partial [Coryphaenoides rupestris]